jgi:chloramphenicol O-acetyltransferase type A
MRTIDIQNWSRREHFEFFKGFNHPHFNMCANVDLTSLHAYTKGKGFSTTTAIIYMIAHSANTIPEFRQRIRDGIVVEHESVSPSVTILVDNDLFSFCTIDYSLDFTEFAARAAKRIAAVKRPCRGPTWKDDLLYSCHTVGLIHQF